MIKDNQVYIGNKFVGDVNYEKFEIVDIHNDNGVEYVVIEDSNKKKTHVTRERFKNLLLHEVRSYKNKKEIEKEFVDMIISKGGIKHYACMAEGRNNYYKLELHNGEIGHWNNFSIESLKKLGIYDERGG